MSFKLRIHDTTGYTTGCKVQTGFYTWLVGRSTDAANYH